MTIPITPEKLRELAKATEGFTQDVPKSREVVMALGRALRADADEIERLKPEWIEDYSHPLSAWNVPIYTRKEKPGMVQTPSGPKPISDMKDGDMYEGGIWSLKP